MQNKTFSYLPRNLDLSRAKAPSKIIVMAFAIILFQFLCGKRKQST